MRDAERKIERQMLTLNEAEMDMQSVRIAEKIRCSCCKKLPASLRLMECCKCTSVFCEMCYDKMLEKVFGDGDSDQDIFGEDSQRSDDCHNDMSHQGHHSSIPQTSITPPISSVYIMLHCPVCKDSLQTRPLSKKLVHLARTKLRFRHVCTSHCGEDGDLNGQK